MFLTFLTCFILTHGFICCSEELREIYHQIFDLSSTIEDKHKALSTLQSWKVRRSHETLTGVLCTLSLLDVHLKDITGTIKEPFTLSTLYASTLTKFLNFAASFQLRESTMYKSAQRLGIDSFLIDLRHLCSHGKQLPSLEIFRKSHRYCFNWIQKYFWENELKNIANASSRDIRFDETLGEKASIIFSYYDTLAELLHKKFVKVQDLTVNETKMKGWPSLKQFMKEKKFENFRQTFNHLTQILSRIIDSKLMNQNPRTFFHEMLEKCDYFMQASEMSDDKNVTISEDEEYGEIEDESSNESEEAPVKRRKRKNISIVSLYQQLIWQIAKHDHLKLFLDMLYQISLNESEETGRRIAARFWITIILRSFSYYQKYCKFSKDNAILQRKITGEVRKVYSYQLDADLKKVFIFVGTQLLPTSLKYSREFYIHLLNNIDEESEAICLNLLPFIHPELSSEQLSEINDLVKIGKSNSRIDHSSDKVYTMADLFTSEQEDLQDEESMIWEQSTDDVDWSVQPIGKDFSSVAY